jgi:hypothetical protein
MLGWQVEQAARKCGLPHRPFRSSRVVASGNVTVGENKLRENVDVRCIDTCPREVVARAERSFAAESRFRLG